MAWNFYGLDDLHINRSNGVKALIQTMPSVLWCCWFGSRKGIQPEWWDAGVVMCLGQGTDLHMAQLMPLPLTISCSSKSRLVHVCVRVCACACACV